jgi:ketosteroid isomerase-like protein
MHTAKSIRLHSVRSTALMLVLAFTTSCASNHDQVTRDLTKRLQDFLAAVPQGDKQVFEDFFADDVIYTRSAGVTVNKAEIIKNVGVRAANEPATTFAADNITVHPYGDMAVVNFRLVIHSENKGQRETTYNRNTGTFLKRNGKWQVVAWQSTKAPPEDAKAIK